MRGVDQACARDDRRAVLVVVKDRDLHALAQLLFDVEALRRLDVLEVDAAERGLERRHALDEAVRVFGVELEVEDVDVGELLEEHAFALHHRLGRERADVAQAEYGGSVGDHRDEVAACGVFERVGGIVLDGEARLRNPRRVGQREVELTVESLGGDDLHFSGAPGAVVVERVATADLSHGAEGNAMLRATFRSQPLRPRLHGAITTSRSDSRPPGFGAEALERVAKLETSFFLGREADGPRRRALIEVLETRGACRTPPRRGVGG